MCSSSKARQEEHGSNQRKPMARLRSVVVRLISKTNIVAISCERKSTARADITLSELES